MENFVNIDKLIKQAKEVGFAKGVIVGLCIGFFAMILLGLFIYFC